MTPTDVAKLVQEKCGLSADVALKITEAHLQYDGISAKKGYNALRHHYNTLNVDFERLEEAEQLKYLLVKGVVDACRPFLS